MTDEEKYKAIINMESIGPHTAGIYPTRVYFLEALKEGLIAGDFNIMFLTLSRKKRILRR